MSTVLTAELVRARRQGGELRISELSPKLRARALELARDYVALADAHVGQTRAELEEALGEVELKASERKLGLGLRKLVEDRLELEIESELEPRALRSVVFEQSAQARRELGPGESLDCTALLAREAAERGVAPELIVRALYADLRQAQVVKRFAAIDPAQLVAGYDLAQCQAVLLRATEVVAVVRCRDAYAYRALFRKLKFFRLLYSIEPLSDGGYRLRIDGPFSLFAATHKYGLELALSLPALLACDEYELSARLCWGKERVPLTFALSGKGRPAAAEPPRLPDDVLGLAARFAALDSVWSVEPASDILALPGVGLCVPDLRFMQVETGEIAYLEVLGYWSRDAVWRRVELCQRGLAERVLFAVSSRLRVSEQVLSEDIPSELYVYKGALSAREVLRRLNAVPGRC